jgi:DNA topoisomerase-3
LRGLKIEELTKPELTGEWEFQLKQMEHGRLSRAEFMAGIADMTRRMVDKTKAFQGDEVPGDFGNLTTPCPKCGGVVKENYRRFQCTKCDFSMPRFLASRLMEASEMESLIKDGKLGPLQGFRSKQGFPFAALLKISADFKLEFDFGDDKKKDDPNAAPPDFTGKELVGKCPKCGGSVFENGMNYVCEKAIGAGKTCDFRGSTIILQQPIDRTQMAKLLSEGKTEKLSGFVSKKTNRKFDAFLVMKKGVITFEFPPREKKRGGAAKEGAKEEPKVVLDFAALQPVGTCPKCKKGKVFDGPTSYICERSQAETKPCTFKIGKTILSQPVDLVQAKKLLTDGRSDLLTQFVSGKTGKNFSAFLTSGAKGKIEFEFPER